MTDLSEVLPDFDLKPYRHLTHSLEKNDISVAELISSDPIDIAKRCPLPLRDLKAMIQDVVRAMQIDLGVVTQQQSTSSELLAKSQDVVLQQKEKQLSQYDLLVVKTLDSKIDECLGGGFPTRYITEIVGESAVGKTQFVLGLLLSVQLKPPHGLGRSAIYLSTEAPLNTTRLHQMLQSHPVFKEMKLDDRPSLDRIYAISTNDLEMQEHIISYQIPVAVQRYDVGLIVLDSVAANFRAEQMTNDVRGLADRAVQLARLGNLLRRVARDHNVAIVATNQVSDRFDDLRTIQDRIRSSSHVVSSSMPPPPLPTTVRQPDEVMTLDHQQRFFTGWGDQATKWFEQLKTPALGLSWANQISARVVLRMDSERVSQRLHNHAGGNIWSDEKKRRYVGVVFAPWTRQTLSPVEYEIASQGIVSVIAEPSAQAGDGADQDMLDPSLWFDGAGEDEEFP